jgi:high-affinity iron transporter
VALGLAGAVLVAAFADVIAAALAGLGQEVFNASVLFAATAMLGWHNVWMKRHGADLAREMTAVGRNVAAGTASLAMLMAVVGLAVLREGSEVVLFLYGVAASGSGTAPMLAGGLLGLGGGVVIGALVYFGLLRIPTRHLFNVTGALLLVLAAGMAAQATGFLVQAGIVPALADPVWDTSAVLPEHSVVGQVLHALTGYVDRPSGMQVLVFLAVALTIAALMVRVERPQPRLNVSASMPGALVALLVLYLAGAPGVHAEHLVYSPIVEQGELAVEMRGHQDYDSRDDVDGSGQYKLEVEYSPAAFWRTEMLGEWEQESHGDLEATEVAWENLFQLTPQGKYWLDVGALVEYAHSLEHDGDDALEMGLLLEKQLASTVLTANLVAGRELASGSETELEYAMRYRWRISEALEPGVELYGGLGDWGDNGSLQDDEHQLGPSLLGKLRTGDRSALRYEAAVLFGLTQAAPDTAVRLLLEFEF